MWRKHLFRGTILVLAVVVALSGNAHAQYPPLSESEVEELTREVLATIETYYRLFNERNPTTLSEAVFQETWVYLDPAGMRLFTTQKETASLFEASLAQILPSGWDHSEFPSPNVCVLSLGAATVSGNFYRYRKDGSVLSEHGVTYVLGRTGDGFKVASLSSHPPGRAVACKDPATP